MVDPARVMQGVGHVGAAGIPMLLHRQARELVVLRLALVDYYYVAGPSFDKVIAGYRRLTGAAPLFPRWAYGYWQSKLAYSSSDQLLEIAAKYRARCIFRSITLCSMRDGRRCLVRGYSIKIFPIRKR